MTLAVDPQPGTKSLTVMWAPPHRQGHTRQQRHEDALQDEPNQLRGEDRHDEVGNVQALCDLGEPRAVQRDENPSVGEVASEPVGTSQPTPRTRPQRKDLPFQKMAEPLETLNSADLLGLGPIGKEKASKLPRPALQKIVARNSSEKGTTAKH